MNALRNVIVITVMLACSLSLGNAYAASAEEINIKVDSALDRFVKEVDGGQRFLDRAKGVLVFPEVIKAGIGIGGEYGEGALRINGSTVEYYSTASASIGFQLGAQMKAIILIFLDDEELRKFRESKNWEVGVDGSVAIVEYGAGKSINTENIEDPVVGFVINNKGLMYNLTLEGSKLTRISR